jgi:shikimate 5-dehydrogenase
VITGRTALYGVVGHPVAHSRSPEMQNAAFARLGVDAAYVALPVAPERIDEALRGAHALGFQGLNVTVPHKPRAASLCHALDPVATAVGAATATTAVSLRQRPLRMSSCVSRRTSTGATPRSTPSFSAAV